MGMTRWPGATWCDVTRDGRIVAVVGTEIHVRMLTGDQGIVATTPEPIGWLRAETNAAGALALVGQGQSGAGRLWVWGAWTLLGVTFGVSPLEIIADGSGWLVYMQTHADRYALLTLDDTGKIVAEVSYAMPPTSQGFLDATEAELLFTDRARRVGGVTLPNSCRTYLVGQDPEAERFLLANLVGDPLRVLAAGMPIWEPRGAWVDGQIVAASRSDGGGAVIVRGRVEDFPAWTPAPVPEPPPVPPVPPVEPPSGGLMLDTLNRLRAAYGPTMTDDECVELCNAAAWAHRAEGYGVSRKEHGTRGRRYDGQECCHDVVMLKDGTYWDCLESAGGASRPIWGPPSGTITDPARGWLAPIVPQGPPVPPDPPVPPQPPTSDVEARLRALEQWRVDLASYVVRTGTGWPR